MSRNEKFYVRDDITRQWVTDVKRDPIQFSSQGAAEQYADKHLRRFTIFSYNLETRKLKRRGGTHVS